MNLEGLRVVVTRPRHQARALGEPLRSEGAEVVYLPLIDIADPESWDELDAAVARFEDGAYEWIAFTSSNAVHRVMGRAEVVGLDAAAWARTGVAAVGRATEGALKEAGVVPDLVPARFTATALAGALGRGSGRVLLPRVERGPREIVDALEVLGWKIDEVAAYRNVLAGTDTPEGAEVRAGRFDVMTFASGSAARAFVASIGPPAPLGLAPTDDPKRTVACIGPRTAQAAAEAGFRVDVEAQEHTAGGLVRALRRARGMGHSGPPVAP